MGKTIKRAESGADKTRGQTRQTLEVISLLLSFAVPAKKTKELAAALTEKFGSLKGLLDASPEKLAEVDGMGPDAVSLITLMKPLAGSYLKEKIADRDIIEDPRDVINYLKLTCAGASAERFIGLYLNSRNELLAAEVLHEGSLAHSAVYPRKVIELAIKHNASSIIFVHSHPDSDPQPSTADLLLMRRLEKAAATVDITVHDHMIIGRQRHFSAKANGWPFEGPFAFPMAAEKDPKG